MSRILLAMEVFHDESLDIGDLEWLGKEALHTNLSGACLGFAGDICSDGRDGQFAAGPVGELEDIESSVIAVHAGHPKIHEDDVDRVW